MARKTKSPERNDTDAKGPVSEHGVQKDLSAPEAGSPETTGGEQQALEQKDAGSPVQEFESKLAEMNERYIRLLAEYDNYRKRTARDIENLMNYATEKLMLRLLPVLDDLDRATEHKNDKTTYDEYIKGITLIEDRLRKILADTGLEPIKAVGEPFDPHFHEAIMQIESDDHESGVVKSEAEKGYMLAGKVIRYAKVIVSR